MGVDAILLLLVVVLAAATIWTRILRHAIIFVGVFSLIISYLYLYYGAPDVAIAEAVIGSGLVMLLYLTAIKRYRTYTVCVVDETVDRIEDATIYDLSVSRQGRVLEEIERFCLSRELEPQIVFTPETVESVQQDGRYDLIVRREAEDVTVMGRNDNFLVDELEMLFILHSQELSCSFVRFGEET